MTTSYSYFALPTHLVYIFPVSVQVASMQKHLNFNLTLQSESSCKHLTVSLMVFTEICDNVNYLWNVSDGHSGIHDTILSNLKKPVILKYRNLFGCKFSTLGSCTLEFRNFFHSFQLYVILNVCISLFLKQAQDRIILSKSPTVSNHWNSAFENCNNDSESNLFVGNPKRFKEVAHTVR